MRIGSLFSGIGFLELGLERAGLGRTVWQVERDEWCRAVLATHWPEATRYDDVCSATALAPVDLMCGGFPCQPFSLAGKRLSEKDSRHLWPEYARIIEEVRPKIVVAENVLGLRTSGLRVVLADLASLGFDVEWACLAASDLGAPHVRKRIFIVATHPERVLVREQQGWLGRACESARQTVARHDPQQDASDSNGVRRLEPALSLATQRGWAEHCGWPLDSSSLVDDGRTRRLVRGNVGRMRKALGNAVVIPCVELIGRAILQAVAGNGLTRDPA